MTTFTIGHSKTPAREFFGKLSNAGVRRVIDVRLKNTSALVGYARKDDLAYLLESFAGIHYVHAPELSPDEELFSDYKKKGLPWADYEPRFLASWKPAKSRRRSTPRCWRIPACCALKRHRTSATAASSSSTCRTSGARPWT